MQEHIEFNGVKYVSLKHAAKEIDLSRDYMARLCKKNAVDARRLDSGWYVDPVSVRAYLRAQEHAREFRRKKLAADRAIEYKKKSTVHIAKSEAAPVLTPIASRASDVHDRMRRALEKRSTAAFSLVSESGRMPGLLQAAADLPAKALLHAPTHAISPAVDLLHRVVALTSAFVLVFGAYSFFDDTYATVAYDSAHDIVRTSLGMGQGLTSIAGESRAFAQDGLALFAHDPALVLSNFGEGIRRTYRSAGSFAMNLYPVPTSNTAAAASTVVEPNVQTVAQGDSANAVSQRAAAADAAGLASVITGAPETTQPVAIAVPFSGPEVAYGDLIAYDSQSKVYTLASGGTNADLFGVVIQDPALLYRPDSGADISVARSGPALMNVTLESGPIAQGDPLTASSIPGKAKKAADGEHIVATAAEAFTDGGVTLMSPEGKPIVSGTISVNVSIAGNAAGNSSGSSCPSGSCGPAFDTQIIRALVRYVLSGIIAALTLTLAFKSFMSDANYGVISIGRNPRAKSSIQSLVFFNAVLALAIASAGLFAAMIVLFAG